MEDLLLVEVAEGIGELFGYSEDDILRQSAHSTLPFTHLFADDRTSHMLSYIHLSSCSVQAHRIRHRIELI